MIMVRRTLASLVLTSAFWLPTAAWPAEGASSNYFPGGYGVILPGIAPAPGYILASLNLFYKGSADRAVRNGELEVGIDANAAYSYTQLLHTWEAPDLGGSFALGVSIPVAYSSVKAELSTSSKSTDGEADIYGLGDVVLVPASFYWNTGKWHFNLYESIIAPTGRYEKGASVNIGRNYWSFDTVLAMTWFNEESGTEFTLTPGLMINTENTATNYRTGTEFHLDALFNQFVSESLALGLHAYGYSQLTGDSGSGALLGDFKGQSWGLGPALSYIPPSLDGRFAISAKYLKDIEARNRIKAEYGIISLSWTF